jgi:RNA-binding protein 25
MMSAASAPTPAPAPATALAPAPAPAPAKMMKARTGPKIKTSMFCDEEEEDDKPKRELIKIEYTEQELAAGRQAASSMAEDDGPPSGGARAGAGAGPVDAFTAAAAFAAGLGAAGAGEIKTQSLIESIPTSKEEIFEYPLDWAVYDEAALGASVQRWVSKKVAELLGEEEPSLVEFVVEKTAGSTHSCSPRHPPDSVPVLATSLTTFQS